MSTTEHQPAQEPATPRPQAPAPADPQPSEPPFTDDPTDRIPVVPRSRRTGSERPHRAAAGEVAALAFTDLASLIPAQREPMPIEYRAAS